MSLPLRDPGTIVLRAAAPSDAGLIANLLELYIHDLSAVFTNVELGPDGRYGYPKLPLYWSEPERRCPFLIRAERFVLGFALVTRGSPAVTDPNVFDVAEFFVLRRYRRFGVGRRAAFLLWQTLPGSWIVRVSEGNLGGVAFWRAAIADFSRGAAQEMQRPGEPHAWRVFSFESEPDAG